MATVQEVDEAMDSLKKTVAEAQAALAHSTQLLGHIKENHPDVFQEAMDKYPPRKEET